MFHHPLSVVIGNELPGVANQALSRVASEFSIPLTNDLCYLKDDKTQVEAYMQLNGHTVTSPSDLMCVYNKIRCVKACDGLVVFLDSSSPDADMQEEETLIHMARFGCYQHSSLARGTGAHTYVDNPSCPVLVFWNVTHDLVTRYGQYLRNFIRQHHVQSLMACGGTTAATTTTTTHCKRDKSPIRFLLRDALLMCSPDTVDLEIHMMGTQYTRKWFKMTALASTSILDFKRYVLMSSNLKESQHLAHTHVMCSTSTCMEDHKTLKDYNVSSSSSCNTIVVSETCPTTLKLYEHAQQQQQDLQLQLDAAKKEIARLTLCREEEKDAVCARNIANTLWNRHKDTTLLKLELTKTRIQFRMEERDPQTQRGWIDIVTKSSWPISFITHVLSPSTKQEVIRVGPLIAQHLFHIWSLHVVCARNNSNNNNS